MALRRALAGRQIVILRRTFASALACTAGLTLLLACTSTSSSSGLDPEPRVLDGVTLQPASVTLAPGDVRDFSVSGHWSDGSSGALTATFVATGGSIDTDGRYTAGSTEGTYRVIAVDAASGLRDTADVTIVAQAPPLVAIAIAPTVAALAPGEAQQFSAVGIYGDDSQGPVNAAFTATGGSVTPAGRYTAGATPGTFRVVASEPTGLADTAAVTITGGGGPGGAECATPDPAWLWCDDFEQNRLASYFEYDNAGGNFVRASGVGRDGSMGMRVHFTPGAVGVGHLSVAMGRTPNPYFRPVDAGTADYRELYWRLYVRNQPGWTGGGGKKLTRGIVFANSNWAEAAVAHVWSGDGGTASVLELEAVSGTTPQGTLQTTKYNDFDNFRWIGLDAGQTPLFGAAGVGAWYCVEIRVRLNDAGQSNGRFTMWIDGAVDAEVTGLNWVGSYAAYGWNAINFENYWNEGSPQAQDRYFDNIVVSTQPIGC